MKYVRDLDLVIQAHLLGECGELPAIGRVEGEVRHVGRGEALLGQRRRYARRYDVAVTLVHGETVFGGAHERVPVRAPRVLDLVVRGIEAGDFGDDAARGDEERRRAVPEVHLAGSRGMPQTGIRRQHQDVRGRAGHHRVQGRLEGVGAAPEGPGEVHSDHVCGQAEDRGDGGGGLLFLVRGGGGGEIEAAHRGAVHTRQAIPSRGHRHGETVLVVAGDGPLTRRR